VSSTLSTLVAPGAVLASPPPPPPFPPVPAPIAPDIQPQKKASDNTAEWVAPMVIGILLVLFALFFLYAWRSSGGKPGLYCKYHLTHSNPRYKFCYLPVEVRKQMEEELKYSRTAAERGDQFDPIVPGVLNRFSPKRQTPAAQVREATPLVVSQVNPQAAAAAPAAAPPACMPTGSPPAAAEPSRPGEEPGEEGPTLVAPGAVLASPPDADGAARATVLPDDEPESERLRRIEWIKYYVRVSDPQKAYDLGWDGRPFRLNSSDSLPVARNTTRI